MQTSSQTHSNTPSAPDLIVRGRRVVTPEGERPAAIHIRGGVITALSAFDDIPAGCAVHEAGESAVMPGLVDTHVHINEPGRTEWEGFTTATRAAAAGGVTTLIEMPLNSIPATTSAAGFQKKIAAAAGQLSVDVGFWGGVVPGNLSELRPLWEAGVFGFKCFLVPSGVAEFAEVGESDLRAALPELAALGAPLLAHAEMPGPIEEAVRKRPKGAPENQYATWLTSRPRETENEAIALLLRLASEFKTRIHIVHLSSSDSISQLRRERARGIQVSVETCPHYLTFVAEEIADGATEFKCAPPIRERENREKLWTALRDGTIDFIASDHSPCTPAMKLREEGDFLRAWGGIASLQIGLPAVWTEARSRGYALTHVSEWMCRGPARLAGLEKRKGTIAAGCDADLVIWNPDAKFRVDPARLLHRHKLTPYAGRELFGVLETTFLRGRKVFERGEFSAAPEGQVLISGQRMKDFTQLADLASERLGGRAVEANDEFFAPKENLLKEAKPIFIEEKYTARGKWMDGWETRRRRTPGHDWCVVRLGLPGIIRGVTVDTSFFKGNYPERFSLEGCNLGGRPPYKNEKKRLAAEARWTELIPETALQGDAQNSVPVNAEGRFTHLRLNIFPDGGVARLRVHGEVMPDERQVSGREIDLAAVENGGSVAASSDQFFGAPRNLLMPGRAKNMGDGWETKRRRGPGHDWVVLKFGLPGIIRRIEVDTTHFKGNFPESCSMEACYAPGAASDAFLGTPHAWKELLPRTKLKANHRHVLKNLRDIGLASHVRFHIYPDGGVSRLRIFGRAESAKNRVAGIEQFNRVSLEQARKALLDCCGARGWAKQMLAMRPFPDLGYALDTADKMWAGLQREDWLEAFRHHPAIGKNRAKAKQSTNARRWSASEQSAAQKAPPEELEALAAANREYRAKFGHVFLICATGKSSGEILKNLHERMSNDPEAELRIAAEEQRKITRLRLEKLLAP